MWKKEIRAFDLTHISETVKNKRHVVTAED